MTTDQYGPPTIAQIAKFIRCSIGDDALIEMEKEYDEANVEPDNRRRMWDRTCEELKDGLKKFDFISNYLGRRMSKWFIKYKMPPQLQELFIRLIVVWYISPVESQGLAPIPKYATNRFIYRTTLECMFCTYMSFEGVIEEFDTQTFTYKSIFAKVIQKRGLKRFDHLYIWFDNWVQDVKEESKIPTNTKKNYYRTLKEMVEKGKTPCAWSVFKLILYAFPEVHYDLLLTYLIKNMKGAYEKVFGFDENTWKQIKEFFLRVLDTQKTCHDIEASFFTILEKEIPELSSPFDIELLKAVSSAFSDPLGDNAFQYLHKHAPESCNFLLPWIDGYHEAEKRNLDGATHLFLKSFKFIHLAGDFTQIYLNQAIALTQYYISIAEQEDKERKQQIREQAKMYTKYYEALFTTDNSEHPETKEGKRLSFIYQFSTNTVEYAISPIIIETISSNQMKESLALKSKLLALRVASGI